MLTRAIESYKRSAFEETYEVWQAGKGVGKISSVESCAEIIQRFGCVARAT